MSWGTLSRPYGTTRWHMLTQDYVLGYSQPILSKLRGASPRIHSGEPGFQAERLAEDYSAPGFSRGLLKPGLEDGRIDRTCSSSYYSKVRLAALPPRSMVGQMPLEQHIGVRIPGGQPMLRF